MNKIKLGIWPNVDNDFLTNNSYLTRYVKKIPSENTEIIYLTVVDDLPSEEQMQKCDAFLLPGGSTINNGVFKLLDYAYQNKKGVLGICLGMQELAVYSCLMVNPNEDIEQLKDFVIKPLNGNEHHQIDKNAQNLEKSTHLIFIEPTSILYNYVGQQKKLVYSFHDDVVTHIAKTFKVTSFAYDGVLESIECNLDWLAIGVQFHPELDENDKIIKAFIDDVKKRKKEK